MPFPSDVQEWEWGSKCDFLLWNQPQVVSLNGIQLAPLEAKALHVIGTLVEIFNTVSYLLYCGSDGRPYANYYRYAYLVACTGIELLGRCRTGEGDIRASTLESGLKLVGLETVNVNIFKNGQPSVYTYDITKLSALRNLIAHGQAVASAKGQSQDVFLHVELLDSFPRKLAQAYDEYYDHLFTSPSPEWRKKLAAAKVDPVLYTEQSGNVYVKAIGTTYKEIYQPGKKPSEVLLRPDWQVYKG
jgi:hypothetical protein